MKDVSQSALLSMQLDGHFLSTYYGEHAAREQTVRVERRSRRLGGGGREEQHCRLKRTGVAVRMECHTGPEQTQSLVSPSRSSTSRMGGEQREAGNKLFQDRGLQWPGATRPLASWVQAFDVDYSSSKSPRSQRLIKT